MVIDLQVLVYVVAAAGALLILVTLFSLYKNKTNKQLDLSIILVRVPKYTRSEKEDMSKDYVQTALGRIEGLFASIAGLKAHNKLFGKRTDIFSVEIVASNGMINFYIAAPKNTRDFLVQQLQAVYPKIYFEEVADYNIFHPHSQISGAAFRFGSDFSLPIRTFRSFESDPLEGITNTLSKLNPDESAAIQYVFLSAPKSWHSRGRKIALEMSKGTDYKHALSKIGSPTTSPMSAVGKTFGFLGGFFTTSKKADPTKPVQTPTPLSAMEQQRARGMEEKTAKPGLNVNIRIVTAANDKTRSNSILSDIVNSFTQYNIYEFGNSFKPFIPHKPDTIIANFIYRHYEPKNMMLLNSEEMASVVHLPLPTTETPNINWLEAAKAAPPANMPQTGIVLGMSRFRGRETVVRIKDEDRRRHMYEIGQTGTGKSVFMESLIVQDMQQGHGLCVIDPHGDLVNKVLAHVPKERAEDVILFDPSDTERPLGINMLEYNTDEQKTFVINEMIAIFDKLYDLRATGGPMFEQYMRNAMLLIMDDKDSPASLLEIPKVLADEQYRKLKLSTVKNQLVKSFWEKEAQKAGGDASLANMVPYITSKLTPFISNDTIRPIIAQEKSSFNFRQAMDEKKIILVNLTKGKIGDMNSNLLGMIIIGKLLYSALSRVDLAEEDRHDFYLYIDEFQNFITESISIILSEARKYRLNLILAHQFIAQLVKKGDTAVRDAIFGNVGTIISYRIGVEDAELIAKQMAPVVTEYDLVNMPKYTAYIKLLIDNQNPPAFNFEPIMPEKGNFELGNAIRQVSRLRYGRPRADIEQEITKKLFI